jgi:hypothetical protein
MTQNQDVSLNDLWESASISNGVFHPETLDDLPDPAKRYLEQAIAPGTPLASAVRVRMHGEIKLNQKWHFFTGEEVIDWRRGMIWRATTWMQGLPIWGADRVVDGVGTVQWKMLGLFPVVQASGKDVTRSSVGRVQAEAVWLPSVLCDPGIDWTALNTSQVQANFTALGEPAQLTLTMSDQGLLEELKINRWGNPDSGESRYVDFGGRVDESGTFDGYTIPTRLRVGCYFGSDRFESEGEFFHCTIDKAIFR